MATQVPYPERYEPPEAADIRMDATDQAATMMMETDRGPVLIRMTRAVLARLCEQATHLLKPPGLPSQSR
jgi:hypothetical protein